MKKVIIYFMLSIVLLVSGCSSNIKKSAPNTKEATNVTVKSDSIEPSIEADIKTLPEEYPKELLPISPKDKLTFVSKITVNNNMSVILEVESKKNPDELSSYYLTYIGSEKLYSSKSEKAFSITGTLKGNPKYTASIVGKYEDADKIFKYNIIVSLGK